MLNFIKNIFGKKSKSKTTSNTKVANNNSQNITSLPPAAPKKAAPKPMKANLPNQSNVGTNEINAGALNIGSNSGSAFISTVHGHFELRDHPDNQGLFVQIKADTPTKYNDLTTKAYVDAVTSGYNIQATCIGASIGSNLNITTGLENGDGLDGLIIFAGQIIMIKDQTDPTQNGIYVVNWNGSPTRYPAAGMLANNIFYIAQGLVNHETFWKVVGSFTGPGGTPVYGTDPINFVPVTMHPGGGTGVITLNGTSPISVSNPSAGTYDISFDTSGVTAGTYNTVTVDANGIVTFGTNVPTGGTGTVTLVNTGSGLTGGPITNTGTISLATTGVTAGTYQGLIINSFGQVTSAINENYGTGSVTNVATGTGLTGGPITNTGTIAMTASGVTAGTYGDASHYPQVVVDALGRVTFAGTFSLTSGGTGTVTQINTGTGLTGGPITGSGTVSMTPSGVIAGTYGNGSNISQITVDALGRVTNAVNVPTAPSFFWNNVPGITQAMQPNNGYISSNPALTTMTLPTTIAQGAVMAIAGVGAGGWKLAQNAGQTIHFGIQDTTTGVGGFLSSNYKYDYIELLCVVANTDFIVKASVGNITVT